MRKTYKLEKKYGYGNLLFVNAAIGKAAIGEDNERSIVKLLLDTGCSRTSLHPRLLKEIGGNIVSHPPETITTANGTIEREVVIVPWFSCLGQRVDRFAIVAHDLQAGTFVNGLLGMDFLTRFDFDIIISVREGLVRYRQEE